MTQFGVSERREIHKLKSIKEARKWGVQGVQGGAGGGIKINERGPSARVKASLFCSAVGWAASERGITGRKGGDPWVRRQRKKTHANQMPLLDRGFVADVG